MSLWRLTTEHLDYLQRTGFSPSDWSDGSFTAAPPERRHELRVLGVGREAKPPAAIVTETWRLITDDLIPGLYGQRIPLALVLRGDASGLEVRVGTWSSRPDAHPDLVPRRGAVLEGVMAALYPEVDMVRDASSPASWDAAGLALGVPSAKRPREGDPTAPIDRIVRAMRGSDWSVAILAHPVGESHVAALRDSVLNELRELKQVTQSTGAASPLADAYEKLLTSSLTSLGEGIATGSWRTCAYLMGNDRSYPLLAGLWRSVFTGETSLPEPIRVWDHPGVAALAADWAMPDAEGPEGPGHYCRPFAMQTLLTSHQLATLVHLPDIETPGFAINTVTRFDAVPQRRPDADGATVQIGLVVGEGKPSRSPYAVSLPSLTRHTFVAGVTGSGKTNTIFNLLEQLTATGTPFLVIEPAKTEYRSLLDSEGIGEGLHVYTVGDERVSPLRLNPFEFGPSTSVGVHLDLLRSLFVASFGMWNPLPQILERCLYRIYQQRGWDILTSRNHRLDAGESATPMAYPTLSDLHEEVEDAIESLGYSDEITSNMRAALSTRIGALLIGGKAQLLDTPSSTPDDVLFDRPVILELEPIGDDDDKAFVIGLVLIRLAELARSQGQSALLRHVLVIEEAHRLFANVPAAAASEDANPRGKAVEAFVNLLAEVRAYGMGIVVADQTPVKLAPELLKNTNLKVAHRLVAEDDRVALGTAMAMSDSQMRGLATIRTGGAALFSEGDDAPLLVEVPLRKRGAAWPNAARVRERMRGVAPASAEASADADLAQEVAGDPDFRTTFARVVQSLVENPASLERLWTDLRTWVTPSLAPGIDETVTMELLLERASAWYAEHRGRQRRWSYAETERFRRALLDVLAAHLAGHDVAVACEALDAIVQRLFVRDADPYPGCSRICAAKPGLCLYRNAAVDIAERDEQQATWDAAEDGESATEDRWLLAADAGERIIEFPDDAWPDADAELAAEAGTRASLCFAQFMLHDHMRDEPSAAAFATLEVVAAAEDEPGGVG